MITDPSFRLRIADAVHHVVALIVDPTEIHVSCALYADLGAQLLNKIDPRSRYFVQVGTATLPAGTEYEVTFDGGPGHCWIAGVARSHGQVDVIDLWTRNLPGHVPDEQHDAVTVMPYLWCSGRALPTGYRYDADERTNRYRARLDPRCRNPEVLGAILQVLNAPSSRVNRAAVSGVLSVTP